MDVHFHQIIIVGMTRSNNLLVFSSDSGTQLSLAIIQEKERTRLHRRIRPYRLFANYLERYFSRKTDLPFSARARNLTVTIQCPD